MNKQFKEQPAIYIFTNKVNGKKYVGETLNMKKRISHYKSPSKRRYFETALKKYGFDGFNLQVIYLPKASKEELLDLEETFIFIENSLVTENGYNLCQRGRMNSILPMSDETRRKLSEAQRGKKHSDESKRQISEGNAGKKRSDESRHKMSESKKGNKASEETKRKLSKAQKGRQHTDETRRKMSEVQKVKPTKTEKSVIQLSLDGDFICEYRSISDAARSVGCNRSHISCVCKEKLKSTGGFKWRYTI